MCAAQTNIQKKTKKQAKDPKHSKMTVLSTAVALVKHEIALCSSATEISSAPMPGNFDGLDVRPKYGRPALATTLAQIKLALV